MAKENNKFGSKIDRPTTTGDSNLATPDSFSMMDMVIGICACVTALTGKKIDDLNDAKHYLNSFSENAAKNTKNVKSQIEKNSEVDFTKISESLQKLQKPIKVELVQNAALAEIKLAIEGSGNLTELVESLKKLDLTTKESFNITNSLTQLLTLVETINEIKIDKSKVSEFNRVLNNLSKLLQNDKLFPENVSLEKITNYKEYLNELSKITHAINSIETIGEDKIGIINGLKDIVKDNITPLLNQIDGISFDIDNIDHFNKIIDNVNSINFDIEFDSKKINEFKKQLTTNQDSLVKALTSITTIIQEIQKRVPNRGESIESIEVLTESFANFTKFFDTITTIGDFGLKKKIKLIANLRFIKNILLEDIMDVIKEYSDGAKDIDIKSLKPFTEFFESILSIVDIEVKSMLNARRNFILLSRIIGSAEESDENTLFGIFEKIRNYNFSNLKLTTLSKNIGLLDDSIDKLGDIEIGKSLFDNVNKFVKFIKHCEKINKDIKNLDKIKFSELKNIVNKELDLLQTVVEGFNKFDADSAKLEAISKTMDSLLKLNLVMLGSLVAITLIAPKINIGAIFTFVGATSVYLLATGLFIRIIGSKEFKDIDSKIKILEALPKFVALIGITILAGSKIAHNVDWKDLGKFAAIMTVFSGIVIGTIGLLTIITKKNAGIDISKSIKEFKQLSYILTEVSIVLAIAALIGSKIKQMSLIAFGALLSIFVASVYVPLAFISRKENRNVLLKGAKDLGFIVVASSLALVMATVVAAKVSLKVLAFAGILAAFVVAVMAPLLLISGKLGHLAISGAKDLAVIILASTLSLILASWTYNNANWKATLGFAAILALFVVSIMAPLILVSTFGGTVALDGAKKLGILILISAGVLVLGPLIIKKAGLKYQDILMFGGIIVGFLLVMVGVMALLELLDKFLLKGLLVMLGINLIVLGMTYTIKYMADSFANIKWVQLLESIGKMVLVIAAFGGIIAGIGGLMTIPGAPIVMATGAITLAAIEALIWGLAKCVNAVVNTVDKISKLDLDGKDMKTMLKPIGDFISEAIAIFAKNGAKGLLKALNIGLTMNAIKGIGSLISNIADAVQHYASLTIPEYDSNGKVIGYRKLNNDDFEKAKTNIAKIITAIAGAIMGVFGFGENKNISPEQQKIAKEMLKVTGGIFNKDTVFGKVIKATTNIGNIIKDISRGLKEYAKLPKDIFGDNGDATQISKNIATIVTALSGAVITAYNNNKHLFESGAFGSTPFKKITKSVGEVGSMVSSILSSVQAYANMSIPVQWDSEGKPIKFDKFTEIEKTKASENIAKIINTIGTAVLELGDNEEFKKAYNGKRLKTITDAIASVSNALGPIAQSIWYYAKGIFPKVEYRDGQLVTVGYWNENDSFDTIINSAETNIQKTLLGFARAIYNAAHPSQNDPDYAAKQWVFTSSSHIEKFNKSISETIATVGAIFNELDRFSKININIESHPIKKVMADYGGAIEELKKNIKGNTFTKDEITSLDIYKTTFSSYVDIVNKITEKTENGFNILKNGITDIYKATLSLENDEDLFAKHTNTLSTYVQTINSVDVSKIDSIKDLITALSDLSMNVSSLDKFTDTISNKLAVVLTDLAIKLDEAGKSIIAADKLHSKRESLIKESVKTITSLMKQELVVKIAPEEDEFGTESTSSGGSSFSSYQTPRPTINSTNSQSSGKQPSYVDLEDTVYNATRKAILKTVPEWQQNNQ